MEERGPGEGEAVMWSRGLGAVLPSDPRKLLPPCLSSPGCGLRVLGRVEAGKRLGPETSTCLQCAGPE